MAGGRREDTADDVRSWRTTAADLRSRSPKGRSAAIVGGGLAGLACASRFAEIGWSVLVVAAEKEPGMAPASAAAAGLLDPLTTQGRPMWCSDEAIAATLRLLDCCSSAESCYERTGILHVPHSQKRADVLRAAAAAECKDGSTSICGVQYLEPGDPMLSSLAPGASLPLGALHCDFGVVVDVPRYLAALWQHTCGTTAAEWRTQRLSRATSLAAAFDCVILAAGAGCAALDETRHLPVDLCRGQTLLYEPPAAAAVPSAEEGPPSHGPLRCPLIGSVYLLPTRHGEILCGATHEPSIDVAQREPPDPELAHRLLHPALLSLYPPLSQSGAPRRARAGVRALPPRSSAGALPLAGRAHAANGQTNVWVLCGLGARGMLYHALVAGWLVDEAAKEADGPTQGNGNDVHGKGDSTGLPAELRRGEWAEVVGDALQRCIKRRAKEEAARTPNTTESAAVSPASMVRCPIASLGSEQGQSLLAQCREQLGRVGYVALRGFLSPEAAAMLSREATRLHEAGLGFRSTEKHNVFLTDEEQTAKSSLDCPRHPHLIQHSSSKTLFAADQLRETSSLRRLYEWPPLLDFVRAALGRPKLHRSADQMGRFYLNIFDAGDELGWHFDNSEFSVSLILQPAEDGGSFEYAPASRQAVEQMEDFPPNESLREALGVQSPPLRAGDLYLFCGRNSLHRVSPVRSGQRINAILTFNEDESALMNEYTRRKFFGRSLGDQAQSLP